MLIPTSYGTLMLALALAALLWGLWPNTHRLDKKWRFELYAFDLAFGVLLTSILLAFTLGSVGSATGFTFEDSLTIASKRSMGIGVGAGLLLGLGQLMVLAGLVLAGMSTALPVAAAAGLLAAVGWNAIFWKAPANPTLVYSGLGAAAVTLLVAAVAQSAAAKAAPVKKGMHPSWKGFILALIGGLFFGSGLPVMESARAGEIGLGSYAAVVFACIGFLLITPLVNVYLLNLPVQGEALSPSAYLKGTKKQHVLGLLGGAVWAGGAVALMAAAGAGFPDSPKFLAVHALPYAGSIVGGLCGLLFWKEQAASGKAKLLLLLAMALAGAASALIFQGA